MKSEIIKRYKHIIWDWNGTLINDTWLCFEIITRMLKRYKKNPVTFERYREIFGFPVINSYERLGFDFKVESFDDICVDFTREYYSNVKNCSLHDGALDVLNFFASSGLTQSVLSATKQSRLEQVLDLFNLRDIFTEVVGLHDHAGRISAETGSGKVDHGKLFMKESGISQESCLMIGDTDHDHEVSVEMGIDCILIAAGHHSGKRLEPCGCPVLDSLSDLLNSP
jgi:phosphoglycolate phosphatase